MKLLIFLFTLSLFQASTPHRILGIFPHTGSSHFAVFRPFLAKLAEVGHDVTIISHFPVEKPLKNYRDISLRGTLPIWKSIFEFSDFTFFRPTERIMRHIITVSVLFQNGNKACAAMMENKEVQNLQKGQFDLILYEDFNSDCAMGLVYKLQLPTIALTSHVMMSWSMDNLGLISNPAYIATHYLDTGKKVTTLEALETFIVSNFYTWSFYFMSQIPERNMLKKYIGDDLPPLEDIARNTSMMFVNTYFPLNGGKPIPPNVLEIGGIYHGEVQELPKDIKAFLDDAPDGVILFSMGSMLKSISLPKDKLKVFQEVFAELPQKVLWKWENDTMDGVPSNVKLVKWIPQFDSLHHKNVKVFITHAGMLGISETIKAGVPALTIPMYGDQFGNAAALEDSDAGVYLDYMNITKESFRWALHTALSPKLQEGAKLLSKLWNDRPMSPMDSALYWVDHVAKYGGRHLQPTSKDLPLYRYLMLDVIGLLIVILIIFFYISRKILRCIGKMLCKIFIGKKKND